MTVSYATVDAVDGAVVGLLAALLTISLLPRLATGGAVPTDLFWSKYVGSGPPSEYTTEGTVLHLLAGALAGAALGWLAPTYPVGWPEGEPFGASVFGAAFNALVFGAFLSVDALALFSGPLELDIDGRTVGAVIVLHLAWGSAVGVALGFHLA